jgi:hypothetical protein
MPPLPVSQRLEPLNLQPRKKTASKAKSYIGKSKPHSYIPKNEETMQVSYNDKISNNNNEYIKQNYKCINENVIQKFDSNSNTNYDININNKFENNIKNLKSTNDTIKFYNNELLNIGYSYNNIEDENIMDI